MSETSPAEAIFFAALERSPGDRAVFLDQACASDAGLRARIERMLAAQSHLGGFLDQPPAGAAPDLPRTGWPEPPAEAPGAVVAGRYKLLQHIGEGGMGSVWMADQLGPVKRRVAVKLIRSDRGSSQTILARFEAERQAIALMDHPHIAKLLDAGTTGPAESQTTGAGRPYFVMELIKGVPLNEYCDRNKLGIAERFHLFTQICSAVQHAHQKGIIHRDLKPSNVLVEAHDDRPVPKVIDFGLAKALSGQALTEHTLITGFGTVAGTPLYMAPEQAQFNAIDVDTRADVYALGAILYELLTGTTPVEREQLMNAPFDEVLRVIREKEPPTPSKRLSSTDSKPSVAANRQMEPLKLGRFLRGDLDRIVMKALAKERDRRYETANGLARDVERFLKHEPVLAGPPSAAYRVRKFVRRNRTQVMAGCLLLLALLIGLAGTTFGMIRAEDRREEADQARANEVEQRARAERARDRTGQALDDMTSSITGDSLATQKALSDEQKKFLTEVLTYYQEFAGEKADDEKSRARTAAAAVRVGLIEYRLGRKVEGEAAFRLACDGYAKLAADFPAAPAYRGKLAGCHNNLGVVLAGLRKGPEAEGQYRKALATLEKLAADFPAAPEYRQDLAASHHNLGYLLRELGKGPEAEGQYRKALATLEKLAADFPAAPAYRGKLASCHNNLGNLLAALGKRTEAEEHLRKALAIQEELAADFPAAPEYRFALAASHHNLGYLLRELGKGPEAEGQYRKALATLEKLAADFPAAPAYRGKLASCHNNLGNLLAALGKRTEAEEHLRKALAIQEKLAADFPAVVDQVELGGNSCNLGNLVRDGGRPGESLVWYEKAIRTLTAVYEQDHHLVAAKQYLRNSHWGRAVAFERLQKYAEAVRDWDGAVELSPEADRPVLRAARAAARVRAGLAAEAVAEVAELMKLPGVPAPTLYNFACVYALASGKSADKKQEYADRAMVLLQQAVKAGFNDATHMAEDPDLDPLRGRDDFKKLLAELAKRSAARPEDRP